MVCRTMTLALSKSPCVRVLEFVILHTMHVDVGLCARAHVCVNVWIVQFVAAGH